MKIALAQLNYHIGNFEANTHKIIEHLGLAKEKGADLVVFAELAVCGYPPRDFLEFEEFISLCEQAALKIAEHCTDIACIIGLPVKNEQLAGKDLFNAAYFIENGQVKSIVRKALLPNYDVFDEYRYFEPATSFECIHFKGKKIALTICEDLWNINNNPLYVSNPMDKLILQQPDLMINIAASPFSYCHDDERIVVLAENARKYKLPLLYVNQIGAQTEIIFDGGSMVFDAKGQMLDELPYFKEAIGLYEFKDQQIQHLQPLEHQPVPDIEQIHDALLLGIKDYFEKSGFKKAVLGLSGGIDSAIVCALACRALGAENVMAVLMPSKYSTDHSVQDALDLVKNIGCQHEIIPIKEAADAFDQMMAPAFHNLPFNLTEENIQARCRGIVVMAMSNKFGYILLNTSNKSECAVGYGTLYGDMCGAIGVIGDVYKTQVYQLAHYINKDAEVIPENSIVKPPSAELRPGQKDSDSLPDYDVLDQILFQYIELKKSSSAIIAQGFDEALVRRIIKMVNTAEFKRYQTPPILRVSPKAFGMGRRMPIVGKYLS
ncbi:NAD+ synthase [Pedobacter sp. HMWF019]|uniref:NAD+ synthase n=1 Tax=Pedobacter sp. HMWF019 TaxID=2056856 RepID=UPI000D34E23E|nr:NAD+ synthase [Pedobacter sp. HMWF019]PTT00863.1 NAD+ synthase [Pedobacter sp. HMWF019]